MAINDYAYPCDKGTGIPLGYHHFQGGASGNKVVCIYCGKSPAESITIKWVEPPKPPPRVYDPSLYREPHFPPVIQCGGGVSVTPPYPKVTSYN